MPSVRTPRKVKTAITLGTNVRRACADINDPSAAATGKRNRRPLSHSRASRCRWSDWIPSRPVTLHQLVEGRCPASRRELVHKSGLVVKRELCLAQGLYRRLPLPPELVVEKRHQ